MDTLSKQQKDILLDYYFECADEQECKTARQLLSSHDGALEFFQKLSASLSPLEHLDHSIDTACPDDLVEKTLSRIYTHSEDDSAVVSTIELERLLASESEKVITKRPSFWRGILETAAAAAAILIISGVFVPVSRQMRSKAWQTACQANLAKISQGFVQYANDNAGLMPSVSTENGSAWWKIGSKQGRNQSNTRHLWLMVRNNYLEPQVFICPGDKEAEKMEVGMEDINSFFDFPSRKNISYSFQLICNKAGVRMPLHRRPIMADANPIFRRCIKKSRATAQMEFEPVELSERLLRIGSLNHRSKGQCILFSDGTVHFSRKRIFDSNDDIFTVKELRIYRGTEKPSCDKDIFLVP